MGTTEGQPAVPFKTYNFTVRSDGLGEFAATEVSGTGITIDVISIRHGNDPTNSVTNWPGLTKYENITVKGAIQISLTFYTWVIDTGRLGQQSEKMNLTIETLDDDHQTVLTSWQVLDAFPIQYTGPNFNASASELAFESIVFAHGGLERLQ
jgi:phage tail-like protein